MKSLLLFVYFICADCLHFNRTIFAEVECSLYEIFLCSLNIIRGHLWYIYLICSSAMVRHNNQLPNNLPQLQNLIKRDPTNYKEEVIYSDNQFCFHSFLITL